MMKVKEVAKDVDVSAEELIEILQDIDISVDSPDAELTAEQIAQVCDELGYDSIEKAREENASAEEPEPEVAPEEESAPAAAPAERERAVRPRGRPAGRAREGTESTLRDGRGIRGRSASHPRAPAGRRAARRTVPPPSAFREAESDGVGTAPRDRRDRGRRGLVARGDQSQPDRIARPGESGEGRRKEEG